MGKIGDLWVRLGLKKDEYTKGMNEAKKENDGFGASLGKMKAGALAVWAAIGTAVVGFAKEMINGTNRIGDAWNRTTAQMKSGWDVFIQSVSNWNWDNFIARIRESANAAKELQNAMDFEFEATNSINLQKAMMSEELAQLQIDMRDVNKSYEERVAAAEKYLSKVKPIYEQEIELRKSLMEAFSEKWLSNSGIEYNDKTLEDLQKFIVAYGSNTELIEAAGTFLKGRPGTRELTTGVALSSDPQAKRAELNEQIKEYDAAVAKLADLEEILGISNLETLITTYEKYRGDKDTVPLVKAIQDYYNAQAAFEAENRRIFSVKNSALSGISVGTEAAEGSIAYFQDQLKKAQDAVVNATDETARTAAQKTVNELKEQISGMTMWAETQAALQSGTFGTFVFGENYGLDEESVNKIPEIKEKIDLGDSIEVPEIADQSPNIQNTTDALGVLAGAISNITGLVDSGAASWASYFGNVLQAVGQAIPLIDALTNSQNQAAAAEGKKAAMGAGSAVSNIPIVGPIMAVAAIASVVAALTSIPKFAQGGIVGGSSYYGDKILARLNSGEMVLNQDQQRSLLAGIERPSQDVHVTGDFRVSGRELRLVLDKYDTYKEQ